MGLRGEVAAPVFFPFPLRFVMTAHIETPSSLETPLFKRDKLTICLFKEFRLLFVEFFLRDDPFIQHLLIFEN